MRSLLIIMLLLMSPLVEADTLLINAIETAPPNSPGGLLRPSRGLSMETVADQYGPPTQTLPAVGNPPITRWTYDGYTVYFEQRHVIRSVVHSAR